MGTKEKINREKGIQKCIEFLYEGKPATKIVQYFTENYSKSEKTVYNWLKSARPVVENTRKEANEAANDIYVQSMEGAVKEAVMTELEAKKLTTDIARSNLADYMVVKTVEYRPRIEISLSEYIGQLVAEMKFEDEFATLAGYSGKELDYHNEGQASRQRTILRHQLELKKNPKARIIVDGPAEWKEVADLDLVKLIADKEKGKIKSFAHTQWGVKVEMYSADAAQATILKLHGSFPPAKVQSQQLGKDGNPVNPTIQPVFVINHNPSGVPLSSKEDDVNEGS